MSMGEIDISWEVLRRIVRDWAGESVEPQQFEPLHGGCINTTLALKLNDGRKFVLKISPHRVDRAYEREAGAKLFGHGVIFKKCALPPVMEARAFGGRPCPEKGGNGPEERRRGGWPKCLLCPL